MPTDSSPPLLAATRVADDAAPRAGPGPLLRLLRATRLLLIVAIVCTFVAAMALLIYGALETYGMIARLAARSDESAAGKQLVLKSIELVDMFLLATVLYVIAIGLYELFIDNRIPVPAWLRIDDIDDLKHKLVSMVISVLAVVFLGQILAWNGERNLQPLGIAVAAVIAALAR